jgi:hypothetical protein
MGNEVLGEADNDKFRKSQLDYLAAKYRIICDEQGMLDVERLAAAYKCTKMEAESLYNIMDYSGTRRVDFYQFKCTAANFCLSSLQQTSDMLF